ncbi:efflux RND transporter periplasmic adaptor subunit [Alteromonas facilis]|uniref:efflux RND transporter periplasmic adaptor subunit n=1 Tax=Alteromonas facilis TaxID=2048004 RepID=UPI001F0C36AF|nr:efflux RND transporter periplasmic adaptor subunit [Alteromonas facilis]
MRTSHKFIHIFNVLILFCSVSANAQWSGNTQATLVLVEPVRYQYEETKVEAVGTAEAFRSVILYPAVADVVTAVEFEPGQHVEAGQLLVKLDDRRQRVALQRAQIELNNAQRTFQRIKNSVKDGAATQNELDLAQTALSLAEVNVKEAQTNLDDRHVLAPFSGVVGLTDIEVGDRITLQTVITTIDQRDQLYVNFSAPESSVSVLSDNSSVTLQPWANRGVELSAAIAQVDSRINNADRTIRARALLENVNDQYRPGMSFRVSLTLRGEHYAAIPEAALLWGATGAYVWKSVNGKAVKVPVNVKQRLRGTILVEGDLHEGEYLVAEGVQRLREGQSVRSDNVSLAQEMANEG